MSIATARIAIIGGGLAGNLLAICLARRGAAPLVVERGRAHSTERDDPGRSINLALAARGMTALEHARVLDEIEPLLIAMRGRLVHEPGRAPRLAEYGQAEHERIFSVSRAQMNRALFEVAHRTLGVDFRFESVCVGIDPESRMPLIETAGEIEPLAADVVLATDGAGSAIRAALQKLAEIDVVEEILDHGYKELAIAPSPSGDFRLDEHALHIWPRGGFMLIALPNTDKSFTATLFLPLAGEPSFAALSVTNVREFFRREFADAAPLIDELETQYARSPTGMLGTVRCRPWTDGRRYLLLGDAAHAIVPFHGQGMNAAFEDVLAFDRLLDEHGADWARVFEAFELERRANADAIADMALENYVEMRDTVRDPRFELRRALAFELERRFPQHFIPRYSMVMFHPEISYAEAQRRGALQERVLTELTAGVSSHRDVDYQLAERLVTSRLG
jgi:kynurenine 3-monooxygenase